MKEFSRSKHFHLLKFLGFYTSSKSCFQSFEEAVQHFERLHDAPRAAIHKSAHFTKFNTFLHLAFKNLFSPQWNSHFRSQCALFGLIVYRYTRLHLKVQGLGLEQLQVLALDQELALVLLKRGKEGSKNESLNTRSSLLLYSSQDL